MFTEEHKNKIRQSHLARNAERTASICEMAIQGKPTKEIAPLFNLSTQGVNKVLRRHGVPAVRGPSPKKGISTNPEKIAHICEMARQGQTAQEIANYYNVKGFRHSVSHIYRILERQGIVLQRLPDPKANPQRIKQICDMFREGVSVTDISKTFHFSGTSRVSQVLTSNGLRSHKPRRTDGYSGPDSKGYLCVRLPPDVPMASMRTKAGIVLEHRLVMARKLGRPLLPKETVHHIDGKRNNNSPDNLQLHQQRIGCP
jgi:transposase